MSVLSSSVTAHIPAWKKLGLKLKNEKKGQDHFDSSSKAEHGNDDSLAPANKRSASQISTVYGLSWPSERLVKRPKVKDSSELILDGVTELNKRIAKGLPTSSPKPEERSSQKRKSVSFSQGTKAEDGDSVKRYKKWVAQDLHTPAPDSPPSSSPTPKLKRSKHSNANSKKASKSTQAEGKSGEGTTQHHLTYLTTYNTSRAEWKFSKRHQNHIFKHLFSLDTIPPAYDYALVAYLQGLQGLDARQRIREQALRVRVEDDTWLRELEKPIGKEEKPMDQVENMEGSSDPDRHRRNRQAYEAEVARLKQSLREKQYEREDNECGVRERSEARWGRRKRAEVVLWAIGEEQERKPQPEANQRQDSINNMKQLESQQQQRLGGMETMMGSNSWMLGRDAPKLNLWKQAPAAKKIVFENDGATVRTERMTPGIGGQVNGTPPIHLSINGLQQARNVAATQGKKSRKRKAKKRTGVPDDDDSSSSSSSDEEPVRATKQEVAIKPPVKREARSESVSSSSGSSDKTDSESGSSESE